MSADTTAMPILNHRLSRNLSPLEEDRAKDGSRSPKAMVGASSDSRVGGASGKMADREGLGVVTEIGATILSSRLPGDVGGGGNTRPHGNHRLHNRGSSAESGEADGGGVPELTCQIQALWRQRQPVCIEVRAQSARCSGDKRDSKPTLLLEKWTLEVVSNRSHPSGPVLTCPQLLLQAVRSHIHFSQIRSWQEVGGKDHTPFLLRLLYRVNSGSGDCNGKGFSPYNAHHHAFPPLPLSPHASLLVAVETLPRLPCIPQQLLATPTPQPEKSSLIHHHFSGSHSNHRSSEFKVQSPGISKSSSPVSLGVGRLSKELPMEGYPFSPPLPSPLSPKLLMGLAERPPQLDGHASFPDLERSVGRVSLVDSDPVSGVGVASTSGGNGELDFDPTTHAIKRGPARIMNSDPVRTPGQPYSDLRQPKPSDRSRDMEGGGGAVPPASCSPAPFSRMHMGRDRAHGSKRRSCAITCKRVASRAPPQRSNSAPVFVPSLCLLGTFEESVLNGRLEPCGHVEGFTAEVGASGAFCPPHIVLPVNAAFYSLHDNHGGTSPYLGQIDLSGVGKRGYQVPRKGTIQVTLFNPNHTVVKMYIVTYDFSDMPALTQTFLRQKILSCPTHPSGQGATPTTYLPSLHYLIHLRFLCSKSKRVYLHRDIRLIFARRAPDTDPDDSKVSLYTTTEGPLEPKYSPSSNTTTTTSSSSSR